MNPIYFQKIKKTGKDLIYRLPQPLREKAMAFSRKLLESKQLSEFQADEKDNLTSAYRDDEPKKEYGPTRPVLAFDYLKGLIQWLSESDYRIMSYRDLACSIQKGDEANEFKLWIKEAERKREKSILIQYDADARPDLTAAIIDVHIKYRIPANVMIFWEKIFDFKLKREGVLEKDSSYQLDFKKLEDFQKIGGVIGYHCNAFDRSDGSHEKALEIFGHDVTNLRKHFDIQFFSMHGGHITKEGQCNATMRVDSLAKEFGLTWVHNGNSVYFHSNWADGSASNPQYRNESNDPLDFILSTQIGQRTRLIFHPQYYYDFRNENFYFPILKDQKWVQKAELEAKKGNFIGKKYWINRFSDASASIKHWERYFQKPNKESPIFINGMSRSGTTLMVSLFDAHPKCAMSYESYPRYLYTPSGNGVLSKEDFIYVYQTLIQYEEKTAFELLSRDPFRHIRTFAAVAGWSGLTTAQTGELLRAFLIRKGRITNIHEALEVVAASARYKQYVERADFWGTKCQGNLQDYLVNWPSSKFIYIFRNGLDVFASQKNIGSFNPIAGELGQKWLKNYEHFKQFQAAYPKAATAIVRYEDLVLNPDEIIKQLCKQIDISFDPKMLRYYEIETTLTKNPRGQLSAERVLQPIDEKSINRWKSDLSKNEIEAFLQGCGGARQFEQVGYGLNE